MVIHYEIPGSLKFRVTRITITACCPYGVRLAIERMHSDSHRFALVAVFIVLVR